jgi:hypothetical protein
MLKKLNLKNTAPGQQRMQDIGVRFSGLERLAQEMKTDVKVGIASEIVAQSLRHPNMKL